MGTTGIELGTMMDGFSPVVGGTPGLISTATSRANSDDDLLKVKGSNSSTSGGHMV